MRYFMAQLIANVDRTSGNYQDVFLYTINASFNGIEGNIDSAQIHVFFPDTLTVYLGDIKSPIQEVRQEAVSGGTRYIFDLGELTDLGISLRIGLGVQFQLETISGTTYMLSPQLWINGETYQESFTSEISLVAVPRFVLKRELVLPIADPAPGGAVFYKVTLENLGDIGASIENVILTFNGNENLTLDPDFLVEGNDDSSNEFQDTSMNGVLGSIENNTLTFFLSRYRGQKYHFFYRATISTNALVGSEVDTTGTWSIDGETQASNIHTITLEEPIYNASISIYGPDYTLSEEYIAYEFRLQNTGNQVLENATIFVDLPPEVIYDTFSTGTFFFGKIRQTLSASYTIDYQTNIGSTGTLGPFDTSENTTLTLSEILPSGENLSTLTWNLANIGVGVKQRQAPRLYGVVEENLASGTPLLTQLELSFIENRIVQSKYANHTAIVENVNVLLPIINQSSANIPVRPGEILRYTIGASAYQSRLGNPSLIMLLPSQLEYIGNTTISFQSIFPITNEPTLPPITIFPNFRNTGDNLIQFQFTDDYAYNFPQMSTFSISFDTAVSIGAREPFTTSLFLDTNSSTSEIPSNINAYRDEENNLYAQSELITNEILFFVSTSSNKKVKGILDTEFLEEPQVGKTLAGETVSYQISLENLGNADLTSIEIVDILPFVGDTSILSPDIPRKSEFPVYATHEILGRILPSDTSLDFQILYALDDSLSWEETPPDDWSNLYAFQLVTVDSILPPAHTLEILINGVVPLGTPINLVAWNSFSADVTYLDFQGNEQHLLPVEPEKVGIAVVEPSKDKGQISGIVKIQETNEGINDVGIVLYKQDGTPLKATFTSYDLQGNPGIFSFGNLDFGTYYVKFFIDDHIYAFPPSQSQVLKLVVEASPILLSVRITTKRSQSLETILKVNQSARSMIRNVIYNQMLIGMKLEDTSKLL